MLLDDQCCPQSRVLFMCDQGDHGLDDLLFEGGMSLGKGLPHPGGRAAFTSRNSGSQLFGDRIVFPGPWVPKTRFVGLSG